MTGRKRIWCDVSELRVRHLVLPSEIEQLPDLQGYLRVASEPAWLKVRIPTDYR